jgi:hypothetical protein
MEISVLQSLIDRTSNEIRGFELAIEFEKNSRKGIYSDFELEQSYYTEKWCKARIPKLVKIQKALKKEIATKIKLQRGIKAITAAALYRK